MNKFEAIWKKALLFLIAGFLVYLVVALCASPDLWHSVTDYVSSYLPDNNVSVQRNIEYADRNGIKLTGDLYSPNQNKSKCGAFVLVHGGSWAKGDKNDLSETTAASYFATKGLVAYVIDYRLGKDGHYPHDVEDVQDALSFLVHNADRFNIDSSRIYLAGSSSGGTTAMLAAYVPDKALHKIDVKGVISFSGPTDLAKEGSENPYLKEYLQVYAAGAGKQSWDEVCRKASPITYAKTAVPTLFIHGNEDKNVPIAQSIALQAALNKYGIRNKLVTIEGSGHFLGTYSKKLALDQSLNFILHQ